MANANFGKETPTLIIESIGIVILAITTVLVMRTPVGQPAMRRGA